MQRRTEREYMDVISGAEILADSRLGPRVFRLADGNILKVFYRRRTVSTALIWPYSRRFIRAASVLAERDVASVRVVESFRVPEMKYDVVIYEPLIGETLRDELVSSDSKRSDSLLQQLASCMADLHDLGVYFRGAHFGNLIVRGDGVPFGLIDIAACSFDRGPLRPGKRARNFRPLLAYPEDREQIEEFGVDRFIRCYLEHASLDARSHSRFLSSLRRLHEPFRDVSLA